MIQINKDVYISKSEFKGKKKISIRQWFTNEDGELIATKKGVNLTKEEFQFIVSNQEEILALFDDE